VIKGVRIRERLETLTRSQGWLAREVGISPQAVSKIINGDTNETAKLYQIARALQTTPEFLTGETDDPEAHEIADARNEYRPAPASLGGGPPLPEAIVPVREIDLKFGMGATELEIPVTTSIRHFSREWLRQYTGASPEHLYFAQGIGDSMAPTILDSDLLLVDASEKTLRMADKIWAVAYGNSGMVKRLRQMADGSVKILSDNPTVPPETAYDGELHVLGRVVAIVRKI
jgi:phage repressor protein C with HTH and peptisase S24 domain